MDSVSSFSPLETRFLTEQTPTDEDIARVDEFSRTLPLRAEQRIRANALYELLHIRGLLRRFVTSIANEAADPSTPAILIKAISQICHIPFGRGLPYEEQFVALSQLANRIRALYMQLVILSWEVESRRVEGATRIYPNEFEFHHSHITALSESLGNSPHPLLAPMLKKKKELHHRNFSLILDRVERQAMHQALIAHISSAGGIDRSLLPQIPDLDNFDPENSEDVFHEICRIAFSAMLHGIPVTVVQADE